MLKCRILSSSLLRSRVSTQEPPALPSVCPQHLGVAAPSTLRLQRVTLRPLTCTSWPPISSHTLRCSTTTCSRTDRWAWAMLPSVYPSGSGNQNPSNNDCFPLSIKAFHVQWVWILFKNSLINKYYIAYSIIIVIFPPNSKLFVMFMAIFRMDSIKVTFLLFELFLLSGWLWTAQSERLYSTEVADQQVGIQQLQLGRQLTPPSGVPKAGLVEPFFSPDTSPFSLSSTALPLFSLHGHPAVPTPFHWWHCPEREIAL